RRRRRARSEDTEPRPAVTGWSGGQLEVLLDLDAVGHDDVGVDLHTRGHVDLPADLGPGADPGVVADDGAGADVDGGADRGPLADDRVPVDPRAVADVRVLAHLGARVDVRARVHEGRGGDRGADSDHPAAALVRVVPQRLARDLFDLDVLPSPGHVALPLPSCRSCAGESPPHARTTTPDIPGTFPRPDVVSREPAGRIPP